MGSDSEAITRARRDFAERLVDGGFVIPLAVEGVFARSERFEEWVRRFDQLVTAFGVEDGAEVVHLPPVFARSVLARSGYLESFPHLCGSVHSFSGEEARHAELTARSRAGEDTSDLLSPTELALIPAACYPIYPTCAGTLAPEGRIIELCSWVFRHEPSDDPARLQIFRQREHVRIGPAEVVAEWVGGWMERATAIFERLSLPIGVVTANDPFFGRGGRLLAANQVADERKHECVVPIASAESPTAITSFNRHGDHFGEAFGIRTAAGEVAHTACVGFGLERVVLALLATHGFDPGAWPAAVRRELGA